MLNFSDDVLRLNPQLSKPIEYRQKRERLLKENDGFDSQLERDFFFYRQRRGNILIAHPFTLHLPGGVDYTPDGIELIKNLDNSFVTIVYECKGDMHQPNARDSRTRFRIAAGLYPCFTWVWVMRSKVDQFSIKVYKP